LSRWIEHPRARPFDTPASGVPVVEVDEAVVDAVIDVADRLRAEVDQLRAALALVDRAHDETIAAVCRLTDERDQLGRRLATAIAERDLARARGRAVIEAADIAEGFPLATTHGWARAAEEIERIADSIRLAAAEVKP
jgi:hypothetical protein